MAALHDFGASGRLQPYVGLGAGANLGAGAGALGGDRPAPVAAEVRVEADKQPLDLLGLGLAELYLIVDSATAQQRRVEAAARIGGHEEEPPCGGGRPIQGVEEARECEPAAAPPLAVRHVLALAPELLVILKLFGHLLLLSACPPVQHGAVQQVHVLQQEDRGRIVHAVLQQRVQGLVAHLCRGELQHVDRQPQLRGHGHDQGALAAAGHTMQHIAAAVWDASLSVPDL
mmetsp:Transcript_85789/g.251182  ORF Transcript_85789/g.251182 Transcript_85789/m.251182 type:complete len:230 (+) Transcript_85789:392-1081(+)